MQKIFFSIFAVLISLTTLAQNTWEETSGPNGGIIYSLILDNSENIFAGVNGGCFKSADNGATWIQTDLYNMNIYCLARNTINNKMFAGSNVGVWKKSDGDDLTWTQTNLTTSEISSITVNANGDIFAVSYGDGAFKSADDGDSWTPINNGLTTADLNAVLAHPDGEIFIGSEANGVFISNDGGANWSAVNTNITDMDIQSLSINPSTNVIYAGTYGGVIYSSNNKGGSWSQIGSLGALIYGFGFNTSGHLYTVTDGYGILKTTNNGSNWDDITNGLANTYLQAVILNSSNNIFIGNNYGGGIFKSVDDGSNWSFSSSGLTCPIVLSLDINSSDHIYSTSYGGFINKSIDNGATWTTIDPGLADPWGNCLAINSSDYIFVGGDGGSGVIRSTDNGATWAIKNSGLTNVWVYSMAINKSSNIIYVGTYGDGVFKSVDNGENWTQTNLNSNSIWSIKINTNGDVFAGTSTGHVYYSNDNGNSWSDKSTGITSSRIRAIGFHPDGVWVGNDVGELFYSDDNGTTWNLTPNPKLTNFRINDISVNSEGDIFVGTNGDGIFRSINGGADWSAINSGLIDWEVRSICINSDGYLFLGIYGDPICKSVNPLPVELTLFYASLKDSCVELSWETATEVNNYGFEIERCQLVLSGVEEWAKIGFVQGNGTTNSPKQYSFADSDLPNTDEVSYRLKQIDNDGQFEYSKTVTVDLSSITTVEAEKIPVVYSLSQNYPNPFNPTTTIKFGLPEANQVTIKVFDILGKEIQSLVNGNKPAGYHEINFDGSNLSSGIYFCRMETNSYTNTIKMIIAK